MPVKSQSENSAMSRIGLLFLLLLSACSYSPNSTAYRNLYSHLDISYSSCELIESPYFLVILVDARHLDYSCSPSFFKTLAKHPSDGSKNGDVGHAWIYLQGLVNGETVCLEGGHSGEWSHFQPCYVEGVFLRYEEGSDDPIAYLWENRTDGFFQEGPGSHAPTFAAKIDLTAEKFEQILKFVELYPYADYSITGNQCCSFAAQIAAFAGLDLDCEITMKIDEKLTIGDQKIGLWKDPVYSEITFSSPDILERSLMKTVGEGRAEYALSWYRKNHPSQRFHVQDLFYFPERFIRFKTL